MRILIAPRAGGWRNLLPLVLLHLFLFKCPDDLLQPLNVLLLRALTVNMGVYTATSLLSLSLTRFTFVLTKASNVR